MDLVDLGQFHSGQALCHLGAASGSPTAISVVFTLEECDTLGGTYTAVADVDPVTLDAENAVGVIDFAPNELKEFARVNVATTLTGGSTPTIPAGVLVQLGAGRKTPA
jgi:hypothetical protein